MEYIRQYTVTHMSMFCLGSLFCLYIVCMLESVFSFFHLKSKMFSTHLFSETHTLKGASEISKDRNRTSKAVSIKASFPGVIFKGRLYPVLPPCHFIEVLVLYHFKSISQQLVLIIFLILSNLHYYLGSLSHSCMFLVFLSFFFSFKCIF